MNIHIGKCGVLAISAEQSTLVIHRHLLRQALWPVWKAHLAKQKFLNAWPPTISMAFLLSGPVLRYGFLVLSSKHPNYEFSSQLYTN